MDPRAHAVAAKVFLSELASIAPPYRLPSVNVSTSMALRNVTVCVISASIFLIWLDFINKRVAWLAPTLQTVLHPADCFHTFVMSQPPTWAAPQAASLPQIPTITSSESSSNIEGIFDAALKSYKKKTKKDLKNHGLFKLLEACDSPAAILALFQAAQFGQTDADDGLKKWLVPTINVLYAFSETLGEVICLVTIDSSVHLSANIL